MGLRLSHKVTLAIVVAMLPLVALGAMLFSSTGVLYREQLDQNLGLISQIEADYVATRLARASNQVEEFAQSSRAADVVRANNAPSAGTHSTAKIAIEEAWDKIGAIEGLRGLAIVDGTGSILAAHGRSTQAASLALVGDLSTNERNHIGDSFVADDVTVLGIVAPIGAQGTPLYVVSEWDVAELVALETDLHAIGDSVSATLVQQESIGQYSVLASTTPYHPGQVVSVSTIPEPGGPTVNPREGHEATIEAYALVPDTEWLYRVSVDEAEAYSALRTLELRIGQTLIVGGLILVAVMATVLRSFSKRLIRIAMLARSVTAGDLTVRLDDRSRDEIGILSRAFDRMTAALQLDIERRESVEEQLAYQASHDALTGLPNRTEMFSHLEEMLNTSSEVVSVLFVDLDGFKEVNDTMGHDAGDELLVAVGERLRTSLRRSDFVGRLGGDEFVVVMPGTSMDAAERMATQVVQTLEMPFTVQNQAATISASIGVACSHDNRDSDELIKQADIAMYRAKSLGKGRAVRVTADALAEIDARAETQSALRNSLADDEVDLRLNPVVALGDGALRGLAASAGWVHPELGTLEPAEFHSLADKLGFAGRVDAWMVKETVSQIKQWRGRGLMVSDLAVEIPLAPSTFLSPRYRSLVADACEDASIDPGSVRVSVPESVLRQEQRALRTAFSHYRRAGIGVSIRRFAGDFADLDLLAQFGLHGVQIDLNRFGGRTTRATTEASIRLLADLAKRAGLEVSASGVDSEGLRALALAIGATEGEGLWFSSVLTVDQAAQLLANRYLVEF